MSGSDLNPGVGMDAGASRLRTGCAEMAAESYKCLEKGDHAACQPFFDNYKACKKAEMEKVVADRRKKFGVTP